MNTRHCIGAWLVAAASLGASAAPPGAAGPAAAASAPSIDLNTATRARLESLKGVGPALSAALVAARAQRPFQDWDDVVDRVPGIGPASARRLAAAGARVDPAASSP